MGTDDVSVITAKLDVMNQAHEDRCQRLVDLINDTKDALRDVKTAQAELAKSGCGMRAGDVAEVTMLKSRVAQLETAKQPVAANGNGRPKSISVGGDWLKISNYTGADLTRVLLIGAIAVGVWMTWQNRQEMKAMRAESAVQASR